MCDLLFLTNETSFFSNIPSRISISNNIIHKNTKTIFHIYYNDDDD